MVKILTLLTCFFLGPILNFHSPVSSSILEEEVMMVNAENKFMDRVVNNQNNPESEMPTHEVLQYGIKGYSQLSNTGEIQQGKPLTIIDYSLPSNKKRIWVIDMESGTILYHDLVSHGRNSGELFARKFSNVNSSYMSSLGFYFTGETYHGKHGYSLRLDGIEKEFNGNARERAIVIHGADYAKEEFVHQTGRLGRSLGCPALPEKAVSQVINLIKEKSLIFIYGNDPEYLNKSEFLNA
ncbi:hypothetical protein P872_15000 [Rhodonellum psychrophilum GCM71 = DSM 17998]|uniref:YkuD domain-containing protein n=2 Tax=Rhodonellum TaxID=336827 RepID=U5C609_9BACT|nr:MULTISPECIES: murein L,D-transpeptidase catalytic domain family protein [Rhodonellum]ERM84351.1 hypothetical protein P872_15000 [Rhodonellum psychrophilum GCM71 = DSM 17998]SDZ42824.1 L,D-transpeptidase catalytic domain [Rhodonellum ikkaensis]